jgi:hypothetical protein
MDPTYLRDYDKTFYTERKITHCVREVSNPHSTVRDLIKKLAFIAKLLTREITPEQRVQLKAAQKIGAARIAAARIAAARIAAVRIIDIQIKQDETHLAEAAKQDHETFSRFSEKFEENIRNRLYRLKLERERLAKLL